MITGTANTTRVKSDAAVPFPALRGGSSTSCFGFAQCGCSAAAAQSRVSPFCQHPAESQLCQTQRPAAAFDFQCSLPARAASSPAGAPGASAAGQGARRLRSSAASEEPSWAKLVSGSVAGNARVQGWRTSPLPCSTDPAGCRCY